MSTTSQARIEANRRNAAFSSGPKTPEGKAVSRHNAFKHGLTGGGIAVPADDLSRIAAVATNLRVEYGPTTTIGLATVDQVATLIVRLDRCGKHEVALVADQVNAAVYDFYQGRRDWADELFDGLAANPSAIFELETFPEGIDRLIDEFSSLGAIGEWSPEAQSRLDLISDAGDNQLPIPVLISGEIRRLEVVRAAIDTRPIDLGRQHAADLALFGTSPEAILSRRYEAATRRALDKAMKILEGGKPTNSVPETTQTTEDTASTAPLGSFLPAPAPEPVSPPRAMASPPAVVPVAPEPPVDRPRRPDPKKLREAMKRKRR